MLDIKFTYGGKNYNSIGDAVKKAMIDGIKEKIEESLRPFQYEIKKANGTVTIDIPDNLKNMKVRLRNMPEELIERINQALL